MLFNGIFSETITETITIKNLKLTSYMVYVNEKILIKMTFYIKLKKSGKALINDNIIVNINVDWNYYH